MQMAVAERGLMVMDCTARGRSGHAARNEGENAIEKAVRDIVKIGQLSFPNVSALLGPVKLTVTVIETENKAHNVVPSSCKFVIDARVNELYTFEEVLAVLGKELESDIQPRSTRMKSTSIALYHPLVQSGISMGKTYYGSPTTSDKALMNFPALKMGPGDSARSHTADEYIYIDEVRGGIEDYINLLEKVVG
jgi:acetylornithine deacetylase